MSSTPAAVTQVLPPPEPELDFSVEVLDHDEAAILALAGEIDMAASQDVSAAIEHALTRSLPVVVDLCDVSFLDSTGVSLVLRARSLAEMRGLGFAVSCAPAGAAGRVFGLVGLTDALPLHSSRAAALGAVRAAA